MRWSSDDVEFVLIDDLSSDPVVTIAVNTPAGTLRFMGEVDVQDRRILARGVHAEGVTVDANQLGPAALRAIAQAILERMDCDELVVQGAVRTSGAHPGSRPGPIRFPRRFRNQARG